MQPGDRDGDKKHVVAAHIRSAIQSRFPRRAVREAASVCVSTREDVPRARVHRVTRLRLGSELLEHFSRG